MARASPAWLSSESSLRPSPLPPRSRRRPSPPHQRRPLAKNAEGREVRYGIKSAIDNQLFDGKRGGWVGTAGSIETYRSTWMASAMAVDFQLPDYTVFEVLMDTKEPPETDYR